MRRFLLVVLVLVTASAGLTPAVAAPPTAVHHIPGVRGPVRVVTDTWGVPHVYATNQEDAFLAQGFIAARDRLFQIDLWRRRGLGQLAEVLGPNYVEQDRATRMFLYRGDMDREWAAYGERARGIATRFTQGINAYIEHLERTPAALPEEFRRLGYRPARWAPEDVVRIRSHGLTSNLGQEVTRARIACAAGLETDKLRQPLQPDRPIQPPGGLDPCVLPPGVLLTFDLATRPVEFSGGQVVSVAREEFTEGSNNWAVAPSRTGTGRAQLANDPHRAYAAPSLRYLSHLSAPGLDVIGANEPALPGVSIGHNGRIAFGLTIFPMDQEDLYVYELDPADPTRYRYKDGWEPIRVLRERISVAGKEPVEVELPFTRHGPVMAVKDGRAFAVRSAWLEPGMAPYFGSVRYMYERDFAGFKAAMRNWGAPTENQVYADTSGNIGWVPGGLAPKRSGYDGLLPAPGDGRFEWTGFHTGDDLPHAYNPPQGFVATANQFNLPPGFPHPIGFEWSAPYRHQRITEVLGADKQFTVADGMRLQNDQLSIPARQLTAVLATVPGTDPLSTKALTLLRGWNAVESKESPQAALFELWLARHLNPGLVRAVAPAAAALIAVPDSRNVLDALSHPEKWFGADPVTKRNQLVNDTLAAAWKEAETLLGNDPAAWQWGRLQHTLFQHALSPTLSPADRARFDVGPFPRGGSKDTVNASGYRRTDFRQTGGASFRMVLDVGNWDAARAINTPGQSGVQADPHYRDLAGKWREGEYFPLLYSRAAVERHADRITLLLP
ncbi:MULTISPECIES: penicillin acylase family protein [unclassified Crossiella]|uniref:penicillin acylase family protein n=1 Tax=unclassified Crossiella TaxID=2620835 RepID=UPI001FFF5AC3|nr:MULTISPECIES: penicillin acylase family protein [unclassified Crossiella]MCK2244188.1 penicillin acylase family protein [Crossiella sp. S99.2]MCK2257992.1 penicillin acylase family protein [Crossiella sp. S99.1]